MCFGGGGQVSEASDVSGRWEGTTTITENVGGSFSCSEIGSVTNFFMVLFEDTNGNVIGSRNINRALPRKGFPNSASLVGIRTGAELTLITSTVYMASINEDMMHGTFLNEQETSTCAGDWEATKVN